MNDSHKKEFGQVVAGVLAYYKTEATAMVLDVWWNALRGMDMEQARKALSAHVTDPDRGQFSPKIADVVRAVHGTHADRSLLAWGKVMEALTAVGAYQNVVFDDPAIHATVEDLGGWPKLCRTPTKDIGYVQHRFCETHRSYTNRGQFEYPHLLGGDQDTKRWGAPALPMLIGDPQRAADIYHGGNKGSKTPMTLLANEAAKLLGLPHHGR
ncbi:MAG: DUF6475 domain-containing protein [Hydrogenophaga sp.]|nr:DUF6475 domain-containing protein [Hydrogenophaga sp.]